MKKTVFIFACSLFGACLPFLLSAQDRSGAQESPAPATVPPDLTDLQLSEPRRLELQDALKHRDYKSAETMLVEEAERDTKSIRTAHMITMAGAYFFLVGHYLNTAHDSIIDEERTYIVY